MIYRIDDEFNKAFLQFFYLSKNSDIELRAEWIKENLKTDLPYHWSEYIDLASIRSILEKGRDKSKIRSQINIASRYFSNNFFIKQYPLDDDIYTEKYIITEVGEFHHRNDTLLYFIHYPQQIIEDYRSSIVKLFNKNGKGIGTGFLIDKNTVVTAFHVYDEIENLEMKLESGEVLIFKNAILPENTTLFDIAIIKVEDILSQSKFFRLSMDFEVLDDVIIFGYPPIPRSNDAYLVYGKGEINSEIQLIDQTHGFILSTILRGGNSGGPIVNRIGEVIGLVSQYLFEQVAEDEALNENLGISFAVPSIYIQDLLEGKI